VAARTPGRLVALEGVSAVGKSTVARALAERHGWVVVEEAYRRLRPRPSLRFADPADLELLERRLLSEERRRLRFAERLRARGANVLLDTGPLGPATYPSGIARLDPRYQTVAVRLTEAVGRSIRSGRLGLPDRIVVLSADASTLTKRGAAAASTHPRRLLRRHLAVGSWEGRFYRTLARLAPGAVVTVRATGTTADVADRVARRLRLPVPPLRRADVVCALVLEGPGANLRTRAIVKNRARSRRLPRR
jgi:AAA domain-containing protein